MRNPPAQVVASWPRPNYIDPENRGPALVIVLSLILALALVCVGLRLYVRYSIVKRTWWDDWLMVAATAFTTGVTLCVILADRSYGWSVHVWDLTIHQAQRGRLISMVAQTLFVFASGLSKLSILISYLRIAPAESFFHRATHVCIWGINLYTVGFIVLLWCQCIPSSDYWNITNRHHGCIAEGPPVLVQAICTVIADLLVYILPMPVLSQLSLPRIQRVGLMLLFGLGSISCIGGIMRIYWTHRVVYTTYDVTWEGFMLWIWTSVEVNTAVICGCIPALRPLLFPSGAFGGSSSGGTGRSAYGNNANMNINRQRSQLGRGVVSHSDMDDLQGLKGAPPSFPLRAPSNAARRAAAAGDVEHGHGTFRLGVLPDAAPEFKTDCYAGDRRPPPPLAPLPFPPNTARTARTVRDSDAETVSPSSIAKMSSSEESLISVERVPASRPIQR